ncbi:hypothetical protein ACWDKQ_10265 [Saccharopolyspora sp. NPDC000995]
MDRFGVDGYREQAEIGVTDAIVVPWLLDGHGFDADLATKQASIAKFAGPVIENICTANQFHERPHSTTAWITCVSRKCEAGDPAG